MTAWLRQAEQALRLRRMRVRDAERTLMRRREALAEAVGELSAAQAMAAAWERAAADLASWTRGSTGLVHRWTAVIETRSRDFRRGCTEAGSYVAWWETQVAQAREAEQAAQRVWTIERARLDALTRHHAGAARRFEARAEETALEEQSEAGPARRPQAPR